MPPPLPPLPPAAEGSVPAAPVPTPGHDPNACANCGHRLTGPFCSQCGQHVGDVHRSVWRFVAAFFDNAFCWDNKLFLTLKPLLGQPGALTLDYLSGRRARYVHPFRLFLFTSAICLTLMQYLSNSTFSTNFTGDFSGEKPRQHRSAKTHSGKTGKNAESASEESPAASPAPTPALAATNPGVAFPAPSAAETPSASPTPGNSAPDDGNPVKGLIEEIHRAVEKETKGGRGQPGAPSATDDDEELGKKIGQVLKAKYDAAGGQPGVREHIRKISEDVQSRLSWVALALLPIFAMMLRALYWRRDSYYFAHFVFSLHYHTFLLIFGVVYLLVGKVLPASSFLHDLKDTLFFAPGVYLFLALRRMYGEAIKRTVGKVLVLGSMHLATLAIGLTLVGVFASYKEFKDVGSAPAAAVPSVPSASAVPIPPATPAL